MRSLQDSSVLHLFFGCNTSFFITNENQVNNLSEKLKKTNVHEFLGI